MCMNNADNKGKSAEICKSLYYIWRYQYTVIEIIYIHGVSQMTKQGSNMSQKEKLLEKREKEKKIIRREIGKMKSNIAKFQSRAGNALFKRRNALFH